MTTVSPSQRMEEMLATLRQQGLRITPQRLAVLRILAESQEHPSVERIYQEVKEDFPTTSLATIYKTVALLKEMNQVLELGFSDWGSRYDGNRPYPHPHIICVGCGAIADPPYPTMQELADHMAQMSGYSITHHRLDFFGLCPRCRGKK